MSVLIKDMEIPKSCNDCEFVQRGYPDWCDLSCRCRDIFNPSILPDWCPLAEVDTVKHGQWVFTPTTGRYRCSACEKADETIPWGKPPFAYCPNCGARMDGGDND